MISRFLVFVLFSAGCTALSAVEFPNSRVEFSADDDGVLEDSGEEPGFDIDAPWGLWANRAPYPYYDGPFGIDADDDLVARDVWFDFHHEVWFTPNGYRGASGAMRARIGLFLVDVSFLQVARFDDEGLFQTDVEDWAHITDARGHIGFTLPLDRWGYLDLAIGLSGFDETPGISRVGPSYRASLSLYPLWPLELEGYVSRAHFFDGTGVNEFGARMHVQVFRHLHVTFGWRWMNVDGSSFSTQGFTVGFSFQFSNLRTFFWAPFRGPAY